MTNPNPNLNPNPNSHPDLNPNPIETTRPQRLRSGCLPARRHVRVARPRAEGGFELVGRCVVHADGLVAAAGREVRSVASKIAQTEGGVVSQYMQVLTPNRHHPSQSSETIGAVSQHY